MSNKTSIKQKGDNPIAVVDSNIIINYSSMDELARLTREGDYRGIADLMQQLKEMATKNHPFFPHYRYKMVDFGGKTFFDHEPITQEAKEKFPLSYKGKFNLTTDQIGNSKNLEELLKDAFFKQKEIEINMISLKAWIGGNQVETPLMEDTLKGTKWVIEPKPLPEPLKLNFFIRKENMDISLINYLELNIRDTKEDANLIILDNSRQQQAKLLITFSIPNELLHQQESEEYVANKADINLKVKEEYKDDIDANRNLLQILILLQENTSPVIMEQINENKVFIQAHNFVLHGELNDLKRDYELVQRLFKLEQFFQVDLRLPNMFKEEDWESIYVLEQIMKNENIKMKFNHLQLNLSNKNGIHNTMQVFEKNKNRGTEMRMEYTPVDNTIELFGATVKIKRIHADYKNLKIENLPKLKKKYEYMDDGETVTIRLVPGTNNSLEQRYFIEGQTIPKNIKKEDV